MEGPCSLLPDSLTMQTKIPALLSAWNDCTAQELNARAFERVAFDFLSAGFTPDDLRCVVVFKQQQNRTYGGRAAFRLNAFKIMGDLEIFSADLAEARAHYRSRPKRTTRQEILEATGRPETKTASTAVHVADVELVKALRKAAE